jgi:hypothetical protein
MERHWLTTGQATLKTDENIPEKEISKLALNLRIKPALGLLTAHC